MGISRPSFSAVAWYRSGSLRRFDRKRAIGLSGGNWSLSSSPLPWVVESPNSSRHWCSNGVDRDWSSLVQRGRYVEDSRVCAFGYCGRCLDSCSLKNSLWLSHRIAEIASASPAPTPQCVVSLRFHSTDTGIVLILSSVSPKSLMRSSVASIPIDTRINPSVIPSLFLSSEDIPECEGTAGLVRRVSAPPGPALRSGWANFFSDSRLACLQP